MFLAPSPSSMPPGPLGACSLPALVLWGPSPSDWGETGNLSQLWRQPVPPPRHLALGPFCLLWAARQKQFPSGRLPLAGITALPYPSKRLGQCSGLTALPRVWGPLFLSDPARILPAWVFLHFCFQKALDLEISVTEGRWEPCHPRTNTGGQGWSLSSQRCLQGRRGRGGGGKPRQLKQSQRQREARARPQPGSPGCTWYPHTHTCACVAGTNHAALMPMLRSPRWGPLNATTRTSPHRAGGGAEWIHFRLADRALPARPLGRPRRDTQHPRTCQGRRGLSPGAHLPERQEPLPGPPPDIRWAENAKNRDFETLLPRLAPQ